MLFVHPNALLRDAIATIDAGQRGIALVVDDQSRLLETLTDGDMRRAMLRDVSLDSTIEEMLSSRDRVDHSKPIKALVGTDPVAVLETMRRHRIRQIPIIDSNGVVVDLITMEDLVPESSTGLQAVVMAGGLGSRLRPLTEVVPKPMLPLGGRPIMERLVSQLRGAGIQRVNVTTHYKGEVISDHFGDGERFGVKIDYVNEESPLGTAGSLRLLPASSELLLVVNGDILTGIDFRAMHSFHVEQDATMTVAIRRYEVPVPYGVVRGEGPFINEVIEKPTLTEFVMAGIYLLEPAALASIPEGKHFDMPDLVNRLLERGSRVVGFPVREYWQDIGRTEDYERALAAVERGEIT